MPRLTFALFRLAGLALLFSITSCSPENRTNDYLYCRLNSNPSTLDPALITDVQASVVAAKLFNGLVGLDAGLNVVPDIAERWEISPDGLTYRFRLKRGFLFANGREVTAHDFKYSFERLLATATKSPNNWIFENVEGARAFREGRADEVGGLKALGPYDFEIRIARPFSPFLKMLTMTPAYVVPREAVIAGGPDFASHPMGTGPYILEEWAPNREVVLKRNERYSNPAAHLKGIVFRILPEDLTAFTEFELGNLDIFQIPASAYSKLRNDLRRKQYIEVLPGLNTYYLGLNTSRPPLDNPALRRAIAFAIDRKKILEKFYEGRGRLADGPVPDALRSWHLDKDRGPVEFNPVLARQIVADNGFSGVRLKLYVAADQEAVDIAEIIQGYLADAGLTITIRQLEWSSYKQAINNGEPDMFWLNWWADYPDAENFLFPLFHSANIGPAGNRTRYANKEVDRLIELGQHATDPALRNRAYCEAEEKIIADVPWVFFWHKTDYVVRQPWVEGLKVYEIYNMDKGLDVSLRRRNY
ncbi:MAG TPA: ABC transporter substrate-binding protein [Dissulfurispiraceae bacterium]|nr:ABC transporter substrate-binding protein [Dissulfurispiraceae bacterium]